MDLGWIFDCSLGRRRARLNCGSKLLFLEKKPSFLQCSRKPLFYAFVPQVTEKRRKRHPKPLPKWSEMGSKINLFSNLPKKSFFGFYIINNHIPTVLGRPFFTLCPVIFLQKRGLRTGTPTNRSKLCFF